MIKSRDARPSRKTLSKSTNFVLHAFFVVSLIVPGFAAQKDEGAAEHPTVNPAEFKAQRLGDARGWDKTMLDSSVLKNNSGLKVSILQGTFKSPDAARREIDDDLRYPPEIVEEGDVKDQHGNVVGKRVVVIHTVPTTHDKYFTIVWNNGRKFHRVASQTPAVAKKFEEIIKAEDGKASASEK